MTARVAKILMVASLAAFAWVVTYDNIIDYGANYGFVSHVLNMDTTFPDSVLRARAITDPQMWRRAYALIIGVEGLTALAFTLGALSLLFRLGTGSIRFDRAKGFTVLGATLAFLLWFTGFMVLGGEWFAMWQSKVWNGQEAAFRFYMTALAVLIFVNQPEQDLL